MAADPALALWLLLLGPCMGSFLHAYSGRYCSGGSLTAPSRCDACAARLTPRDLVPLASWLALRGRCRHCGAPLPRALLATEVAGGVLALAVLTTGATGTGAVVAALWLWCLMGLFLTDARCLRLPDALTAPLLALGLWLGHGQTGLAEAAATAAAASAALWLLARAYARVRGREGLGLGDVKMIAGIGAAVGPVGLPWVTLLAAVGILAHALGSGTAADRPLPFGAALAVAAGLVWLWP